MLPIHHLLKKRGSLITVVAACARMCSGVFREACADSWSVSLERRAADTLPPVRPRPPELPGLLIGRADGIR